MAKVVVQADQAPVAGEPCSTEKHLINHGAPNVPFFTPIQDPPAGSPWDVQPEGSLFSPLKINETVLHNRIIVSPMCQYSAKDGYMTMWHHVHLGSFAARGPGLILTEATAVSPEGRISPQDLGLWEDGQIEPLQKIVEFAHCQGVKIGVQLAHAGRKASTVAPWVDRKAAAREHSEGWPDDVIAPSPEAYSAQTLVPREATKEDIEKFKKDWVAAIRRALKAGVDTIEVHGAHGYLLNEFLSPSSNKRTDEYGGSFENRIRLYLEAVDLLKAEVPSGFPILARVPATDYLEHDPDTPQWTLSDAIELSKILVARGVHFLDVTGGGTDARQRITAKPGYQVPYADAIRKAVAGTGALVGTVGEITSGKQAQGILDAGSADAIVVGRAFLKDPDLVWHWADELDLDIHVPSQYGWGFGMTRTHRHKRN
ncbi:FMN-linked oxidoreductase [Annulohypoxylon maeteangense]|uniref:FMN-linked oxidoreductase n=1 Tax=Annulohypoxylon maeteangense TaxID=1927788 RepID=UPI00200863B8|nr:FMN-linked oxidoreductase [Annulohypoxylon maeteangense]KAI0888959.1 FMN-linked oxidoreductase [Annulohypoxylon maeteangense]